MTQDEHERLVRLEMLAQQLAKDVEKLSKQIEGLSVQITDLTTKAAMGRGAWWMLVKVGGLLTVISGLAWAVYTQMPRGQ